MSQADDEFKAGKGNSRKEFIENLIRESKEKTDDLDKSWKDLYKGQNDIWAGMKRKQDDEAPASYDPYDMLVKSLGFEKKEARGGERLKTEDEKLVEEKERLEKLEEDRQRRMRGEKVSSKMQQHVSVDDTGEDQGQKKKVKMSRKEQRKLMKQLLKEKSNEEGDDKNKEDSDEDEEDEEGEEEEEESEEESDADDDADSEEDEEESEEE